MTAAQNPLGTPFGPFTTAEEAARDVDFSGKTAVVTGGASNLGRETARVLASRGAHVVVPVRGADAARRAPSDVPGVEVVAIDLLDPAPVRGFADGFLAAHKSLDLLILSAGVMASPLFRDAEGQ
jgi:NAD(P)-dependent dehydrogenase (short-subunit alcohol dehydrogenase family)